MGTTRFELAALASECLRRYVDTDPLREDPTGLVQRAADFCTALVEMEQELEPATCHKASPGRDLPTAVREWQKKFAKLQGELDDVRQFFAAHGGSIDHMVKALKDLQALGVACQMIDRRLENIRLGLDAALYSHDLEYKFVKKAV